MLAAVSTAVWVSCVPVTSPDKGRYSCAVGQDGDCGSMYECKAQFDGGGRCFALGECIAVELCSGVDDNCDGRIDETFPDAGQGCETAKPGRCKSGALACTAGAVVCRQTLQPVAESCNSVDDDCDGTVDNGFNLTIDQSNCGLCGNVCGLGTACVNSHCREAQCGDGIDNDDSGVADCDDDSCLGQECQAMPAPALRCGVDAGVRGCYP